MKFNEEKHIYTNDNGEVYMGVTSLIKKFCKPFDRIKKGKKAAKEQKRTLEEVLADWDKAGRDSIVKGTFYHKLKEDELLDKSSVCIDGEDHIVFPCSYEEQGDKITHSLKLEPGIYPELLVWSDRYRVAGQADYVEITKTGKINIRDYKTSKEIKLKSYPKWDGTPQRMEFPFNHLEDCNYSQYALQLNMYAYLIKIQNRGLEVGKLAIEHVKGEFDEETKEFKVNEVIEYEVPNLQDDVKIGLEYYVNQLTNTNKWL